MFWWDSCATDLASPMNRPTKSLVPRQVGVHDLKRHLTVEPGVGGEVDGGHAAVRDARRHGVTSVQQAPGKGVGQRIVHGCDFTVVCPPGAVNHGLRNHRIPVATGRSPDGRGQAPRSVRPKRAKARPESGEPDRSPACRRVAWCTVADSGRVVVAGAGLAGLRTVEELRARGLAGRITLIGAEPRPPYDRPPLSKKVLTQSDLDPSLHADFAALDVDFRPGEAAVRLEQVTLVTGQGEYPFDHLVLATGAVPVALPGEGRQRFLRSYDDALALRDLLRPGLRLAIIGAGWIGAELATAAAARGAKVTVVEAGPAPLASAVGALVGAQTVPWYASAGVDLRIGGGVQAVQPGGLALDGGEWVAADEIVTAVGVRPADPLAGGFGRKARQRRGRRRGPADLGTGRLRGRGLRRVRVAAVRAAAAVRALGRGPARARGGRG